jgi:signal transduction histidine kinase
MKQSYTWKLTTSFCLILVFFAIAIVLCEQYQERKFKTEAMQDRLDDYAEILHRHLLDHPDPQSIEPLLALFPPHLRVSLIDSTGEVLYDNQLNLTTTVENHAHRPEILRARQQGKGSNIRLSASTQQKYLYYAKQADDRYIRLALPYDIEVRNFLTSDNLFLYYLLLLLAFGLLFIRYTAARFGRTIRQLRDYSNAVSRNQSPGQLRFPDDEIGEISKHIAEDHRHLKQELTGNIAHELRTPVTGIRGYLETILYNKLDRAKEHEFVNKAHEQILTLSELIRDMSLLSRINESPGSFHLKPVILQRTVEKVAADLEPALQKKNISVCSFLPDGFTVQGNDILLYSVFRNLIDNTINYGGEDTLVEIRYLRREGPLAILSFTDNGPGIQDERHLPRLFERFYRVEEGRSRDTGGSGLGLSIVKNVIIFHGGNISVRNRPTGGLEFIFSLQQL